MEQNSEKLLRQWYALKNQSISQRRRLEDLTEEIRQLQWEKQQQEVKRLEYTSSLTGLLDRLRGKREEKEAEINRILRATEAVHLERLREKETLLIQMEQVQTQLEELPHPDQLRSEATENLWAVLEIRLATVQLIPILNKCEKTLLALRQLLQGATLEIISIDTQQQIHTAPIQWAENAQPLLQQLTRPMEILGRQLQTGGYFQNPAGFLGNATRYTQMDRVNQAIRQTQAMQKQLIEQLAQIAE